MTTPGDPLRAAPRRHPCRRLSTYLALGVAVLGAYAALHDHPAWRAGLFVTAMAGGCLALAVGIRDAAPRERLGWRLVLAAACWWTLTALAPSLTDSVVGSLGRWAPMGVSALPAYPVMAAGLILLLRADPPGSWGTPAVEATVGTISFVTQWWLMTGHDVLTRPAPDFELVVAALTSLADLVVVIPAMVLLSVRAGRDPAIRWLALAAAFDIGGDITFASFVADASTTSRLLFPALWMTESLLLGAAGLSLGRGGATPHRARISTGAIAGLLAATVGPLVTLAVRSALATPPDADELAITLACLTAMLALTSSRIRGLVRRIEEQADALERTARTDELTGLPNRRAGIRLLDEAVTAGPPLVVAVVDLDHFKDYNDRLGHLRGDRLLQDAGLAWASVVADHGVLYRHGGEEFVALVTGRTTADAVALVERLRAATPDGQDFSAGVAALHPGEDADAVFARADRALYQAKSAGRGTTVVAP